MCVCGCVCVGWVVINMALYLCVGYTVKVYILVKVLLNIIVEASSTVCVCVCGRTWVCVCVNLYLSKL